MELLIEKLKSRLLKDLPGSAAQLRMAPAHRATQMVPPEDAFKGAVMILLYHDQDEWNTMLIKRTADGTVHSGQIGFPGGKRDQSDPDIIYTACRECEEEIGIPKEQIEILGCLSPLYIPPSNFHVTPVLGFLLNEFTLNLSENEVQHVIPVSLRKLFDDNIKESRQIVNSAGLSLEAPVYAIQDRDYVWGATAMMICELEILVKELYQP